MPPPPSRRRSAQDRETRRLRIMASLQAGHSYQAIGHREGLTRERVRQIVLESVRDHGEERFDLPRVQMARLEPALQLAAGAVGKGRLTAIPTLLKILAQIDKYSAAYSVSASETEGSHERLMAKINRSAWRQGIVPTLPPSDAPPSENLESRDSSLESSVTL